MTYFAYSLDEIYDCLKIIGGYLLVFLLGIVIGGVLF